MKVLRSGSVVRIPPKDGRLGLTVVLIDRTASWWCCKVVDSPPESAYQVGGYDVSIHADDLREGEEIVGFLSAEEMKGRE